VNAPWVFRILLYLYPREFRERYGSEMLDAMAMELEGTGAGRRVGVWVWGTADLLWGAAREWTRILGRGGGMGTLGMDVRQAVRGLLRRPGLSGAAVMTLALGIGATATVFSLVNGLLLKPLPYHEADRLVHVWLEHRERGWQDVDVTLPDAWAWRERTDVFNDLAAFTYVGITDGSREVPERLDGVWATWNLLQVLGVEPVLGRAPGREDGREGAARVTLVSHGYWTRVLGRDPRVVGSELELNGRPATVIGVLPSDFQFPGLEAQFLVPWAGDPVQADRDQFSWQALGRLADDVSLERAQEATDQVVTAVATTHPETHEGMTSRVVGLREEVAGEVAPRASYLLLGAVVFLLLMACVNVANLLLARGADRAGEMAVRAALGAGRGRLIRQLFAEALLLSLVGGSLGVLLARWGRDALVAALPENLPPVFHFPLDLRVLAFAAAVSVASALVFGLVPAFRASAPAGRLRSHGRGGTRVVGGSLVVVQTALAVLLLVGTSVTARSVLGMARQEMGWEASGLLLARLSPRPDGYPTEPEVQAFHDEVLARIRALPGVAAAGGSQAVPLQGQNLVGTVALGGEDPATSNRAVRFNYVTPGYFDALGLEVLQGRGVGPGDGPDTGPVAVVNRAFVARHLDGMPAPGVSLHITRSPDPVRIVGVVEDAVERNVDRPVEPSVFMSMAQWPTWTRTLAVRVAGERDPLTLVPDIRRAVAEVDPGVAVFHERTMEELVTLRLGGFTLIAKVMGTFGLLSLILGGIGIYGVISHNVVRRTREIGVRLALGADPGTVRREVVRQGLGRVLAGLGVGLLLALPLTGLLRGVVVGVDPRSPLGFALAVGILLAVGGLGAWLPARRASQVDPAQALAVE
jgi:putative ABC transport system permease protein